MEKIGRYSFEQYLEVIKSFHGNESPGLVLGGIMVDYALGQMEPGILFDAICETSSCLPDAIQLLTPCTIGNGWLKVIDLGRFALSLYDKYRGEGVRVYVDAGKLNGWEEIWNWFYKLKTKREQDKDLLLAQIREAGYAILSASPVRIDPRYLGKTSKGAIANCPGCGEPYPQKDGALCLACCGGSPYEKTACPRD